MQKKNLLKNILSPFILQLTTGVLLSCLLSFSSLVNTAFSQTPSADSRAFTIVPPSTELAVDPGETKTITMKAINDGRTPLSLKIKFTILSSPIIKEHPICFPKSWKI